MDKQAFRTIESLGRGELINELMEHNAIFSDAVVQGYGDDSAVLKSGEGEEVQLLSSESIMEGVDFDMTYIPLHHLGYKIATGAVSDIYAMNGSPQIVLVNLSVPNKMSVDMLKEIYRGIAEAGKDYEFQIAGGDLTASHRALGVSITCQGKVPGEKVIYRSGARTGDAICVTGDLGGATAGLRILVREKRFWEEQDQQQAFQPDLSGYEYVVRRQLLPVARKDVIEQLAGIGILPTSMIDLTQGLLSELKHVTEASKTGAYFYQSALPISPDTRAVADEMKEDVDKYALYGGEDYELIFTLPEQKVERLANEFADFTVIGKITDRAEGIRMQRAEGGVALFDGTDKDSR